MLTPSKKKELFSSVLSRMFKFNLLVKCRNTLSSTAKRLFELVSHAMAHHATEGSILNVAFDTYITQVEPHKITTSDLNKIAHRFCEEQEVQDVLEQVHNKIVETYQAVERGEMLWESLPADLFTIAFSAESIIQNITDSVREKYSPTDERELSSDDRKLRRMDSMARLLSLAYGLSVCTSVTLDTTQSEPRFVIGANVGKNGDQEEILTHTASRLRVIQDFLATISSTGESEIHIEDLTDLAKELVSQIIPYGGASIPSPILEQAAFKIIHSYCFDENETFSPIEKGAFHRSAPSVILVPKITDTGRAQIQARTIRSDGWDDSFSDLPELPRNVVVKNIHAEQLTGYFLFVVSGIPVETKFDFGVSKLCCRTCFSSIKTAYPNVALRGQHGQVYQGVVDLHSGECQPTSSLRPATTCSWQSPKETPYQQRSWEVRGIQRKARKRLFETFDETTETAVAMGGTDSREENPVESPRMKRTRELSTNAIGSSSTPEAQVARLSISNTRYAFRFNGASESSCFPSEQRKRGNPDLQANTNTSAVMEDFRV